MRKTKFLGHEIVFFVEDPARLVSFTGRGVKEEHGKYSLQCHRRGFSDAEELARRVEKAFGDYEKALSEYEIRSVSENVCEHCGKSWTEDSDEYNGGCCTEDQDAHEQTLDSNNSAEVEA